MNCIYCDFCTQNIQRSAYAYNIKVKLFADDVKLYVKVINAVDVTVGLLHEALAALVTWADEWQLSISVNKCGVLCIGKDRTVEQFSINNTALPILLLRILI